MQKILTWKNFLPKTSKSKVWTDSPTIFDALIVYFPKWVVLIILAINKLFEDVFGSVSNLTPSFVVNSLPFKNQDNFAFGKASTKHSNLTDWLLITTIFFGAVINVGDSNLKSS